MTSSPPRLIVEVCHGRHRGLKAHLAPGLSLTVGRTDRSDVPVRRDRTMAGVHFRLTWDGAHGWVEHLGGSASTSLDGQPIERATLRHGGWIRAGQTDFQVFVEGRPAPATSAVQPRDPVPLPQWWPQRADRAAAAGAQLATAQPLYGVLDPSRHPQIIPLVRASIAPYRSLFEGGTAESLHHVAPHLVAFGGVPRLLSEIVHRGWGRRWAIFMTSDASFEQMRRHLRRFLMVRLEGRRRPVFFRYYDPWVLGDVWRSLPPRQRSSLMGPIEQLLFEDALDLRLRRFTLRDAQWN